MTKILKTLFVILRIPFCCVIILILVIFFTMNYFYNEVINRSKNIYNFYKEDFINIWSKKMSNYICPECGRLVIDNGHNDCYCHYCEEERRNIFCNTNNNEYMNNINLNNLDDLLKITSKKVEITWFNHIEKGYIRFIGKDDCEKIIFENEKGTIDLWSCEYSINNSYIQNIKIIEEDNNNKENMSKFIDTTDYKACEEANRKVLDNNKLIIEEIIWNDCSSLVNQWQPVKDVIDNIHKINPVIKSIGYVLFEDDKFLILGNSVDKEDLTVDGACVNGGMKIYKPQIIKRSVI